MCVCALGEKGAQLANPIQSIKQPIRPSVRPSTNHPAAFIVCPQHDPPARRLLTLRSTTLVGLLNSPRFLRPAAPPAAAACSRPLGGGPGAGPALGVASDGPLTVPWPPPTARYWMGLVMPCASRPSPGIAEKEGHETA